MVEFEPLDGPAVAELRSLASQGRLADVARSAPPAERTQPSGAASALAWPIVERPLGMNTPPLAPAFVEHGSVSEPPAMALTEPDEATDARLADLASLALMAIDKQLADDPADEAALSRIITNVFGRLDGGGDFARVPDQVGDHSVLALIDDPDELRRIVRAVREIIAGGAMTA